MLEQDMILFTEHDKNDRVELVGQLAVVPQDYTVNINEQIAMEARKLVDKVIEDVMAGVQQWGCVYNHTTIYKSRVENLLYAARGNVLG